ncbi:hypothetical protein QUF90_21655 [Desulfococcaceae bacterium HSG9]|nr:hypothetical protein [Desulfococcaceae bacterium HSG9]
MLKRKFFITLFVIMVSLFLLAPICGAKLTSSINAEKTVVTVGGVRVSQTAWGQGTDNYTAGVTSKERLPTQALMALMATEPDIKRWLSFGMTLKIISLWE